MISKNDHLQVDIDGITYAGNHGLEIIYPDGTKFVHPVPSELEDKVGELLKKLQDQVCLQECY
jgi:trehalose 6-phosphate synthase/phosphatase